MSNFEDNGTDYTVAVDAAEFREVDISTGMFLLIAQKDGKERIQALRAERDPD